MGLSKNPKLDLKNPLNTYMLQWRWMMMRMDDDEDASQPLHHHLHIMYFLIIWSSYSTQLTIKRNELSLELIVQLSIHLTMVLLSQTDYSLESGLQSIFQESKGTSTTWWYFSGLQAVFQEIEEKYNTNFWFFVFSVVWSFKTTAPRPL